MVRIDDNVVQDYERKHEEILRRMAPECTLFLQRDGAFPLQKPCKLAVFGNGVRHTVKGGTGSGDVNVRYFVNVEEGLLNAGFDIVSTSWLEKYEDVLKDAREAYYKQIRETAKKAGVSPIMLAMGKAMPEPEYELPIEGGGEAALYILARISGEGNDRSSGAGDIALTETEKRDILKLNGIYDKFMLVLNVGGLVDLSPVKDVKNILMLGQLGTCTGTVLPDILLGKSNPSGKLAMTWAELDKYPSTQGFGDMNDTYYTEDIYVGYRYFDTIGADVLYPFGYGLSYTDFGIVAGETTVLGDEITVHASVKNIGKMAGKEVVQLYVSVPGTKLEQPYQSFAGFVKTKSLDVGEECEVSVSFCMEDIASYDEGSASWILEKGNYILRLGNHSRATHVCGIIHVKEDIVTKKLKNLCVPTDLKKCMITTDFYGYEQEKDELGSAQVIEFSPEAVKTEKVRYGCIAENFPEAKKLTREEKISICVGRFEENAGSESIIGVASFTVAGAAGETTDKLREKYGMGTLVLADGPAGVRINNSYKIINGKVKGIGSPFGEEMMGLLSPEETAAVMQKSKPSQEEMEAKEYYQYCTALPIGTDLAQSFNLEVMEKCGDIIGREMKMFGIHLWLAPALNIQRSPLCGRNFEYFSEDPLVSGLAAAAITKGVQSHKGCGTTIKHFACNNQETNRYTSNSILSERALREIYLRGFEICISKEQPLAMMSSYNLINGEHACNSRELLTNILRDEWGFEGIVMTDWYATTTIMKNPLSKYAEASAAGCIKAGNDLVMPGGKSDMEDIINALQDEKHPYSLEEKELGICAERMLKQINRLQEEK